MAKGWLACTCTYHLCNLKEKSISFPGLAGSQQGKRSVKDPLLKTPTGTGYRVGCSLVCVGHRLPKKGLVTGWLVQLGIKIYYDNVSALT